MSASAKPISPEEMAGIIVNTLSEVYGQGLGATATGRTVTFRAPATGQRFTMDVSLLEGP